MIHIISRHQTELIELENIVKSTGKEYKAIKHVNTIDVLEYKDGDVVVGKLPMHMIFAITSDIDFYVPYKPQSSMENTYKYHKYLIQQVSVDDESCPALILLGQVAKLEL